MRPRGAEEAEQFDKLKDDFWNPSFRPPGHLRGPVPPQIFSGDQDGSNSGNEHAAALPSDSEAGDSEEDRKEHYLVRQDSGEGSNINSETSLNSSIYKRDRIRIPYIIALLTKHWQYGAPVLDDMAPYGIPYDVPNNAGARVLPCSYYGCGGGSGAGRGRGRRKSGRSRDGDRAGRAEKSSKKKKRSS